MSLNLHLKIVGTMLLLLALCHAFFPKRFQWKEELQKLSRLNGQIFLVHCAFIVLILVLLGLLSLFFTETLLEPTPLGRVVLSGLTLFWVLRLATQLFVYDARLWRGHRFNTFIHVLFSCLWCYFVAVFSRTLWHQFYQG